MVWHLDITQSFLCGEGGAWQKVSWKKRLGKGCGKAITFTIAFAILLLYHNLYHSLCYITAKVGLGNGVYENRVAAPCNTLQHTASLCENRVAKPCNTLQHTATHCNTLWKSSGKRWAWQREVSTKPLPTFAMWYRTPMESFSKMRHLKRIDVRMLIFFFSGEEGSKFVEEWKHYQETDGWSWRAQERLTERGREREGERGKERKRERERIQWKNIVVDVCMSVVCVWVWCVYDCGVCMNLV